MLEEGDVLLSDLPRHHHSHLLLLLPDTHIVSPDSIRTEVIDLYSCTFVRCHFLRTHLIDAIGRVSLDLSLLRSSSLRPKLALVGGPSLLDERFFHL